MHATTIRAATMLLLGVVGAMPLQAQTPDDARLPGLTRAVDMSGPRFGMTVLSQRMRDKLNSDREISVGPVISQFGWQFEKQFLGNTDGMIAVYELILLAGGLDQGSLLPSATWLVGVRGAGGFELGVGPNATPAGVALAMAAGFNFKANSLNVPVNVAIVPSKYGVRLTALTGFTLR